MKLKDVVLGLLVIVLIVFAFTEILPAISKKSPNPQPMPNIPPVDLACDNRTYQTACPEKGTEVAVIQTNLGTMEFRFFPEETPETFKNFTELAKKGYYDGLIFHRVIKDFMIQGGDPTGTGIGGETYKGPNTVIVDEFNTKLKNLYGTLSMANRGPNTGTSQFFIVQKKEGTDWLDNHHTVFGQIYKGTDILDKIAAVQTGANDKPAQDVIMEKVEIKKY